MKKWIDDFNKSIGMNNENENGNLFTPAQFQLAAASAHKRKSYTYETEFQAECAALLDALGFDWFHPSNEGKRRGRTGTQNKNKGVKRGVPDIVILNHLIIEVPIIVPHFISNINRISKKEETKIGCVIELKNGMDKSPEIEQQEWLIIFNKWGWLINVCRTWDEFTELIGNTKWEK
jgi:hypothetical protein